MAPQFTSAQRADVYRLMYRLNRAFHFIVQCLDELDKTGICTARDMKEARGLVQEVQLEIMTGVLNPLESIENNDWAFFGKTRLALEKRLRGPEPKQRKKAARQK